MSDDVSHQPDPESLASLVREKALEIGFDLVGISAAVTPVGFDHLRQWLDRHYDGEMQYMKRRESAYEHPDGVLPGSRSVVIVGLNYHSRTEPAEVASLTSSSEAIGRVARYACGSADYHDVIRKMLKHLAGTLHEAVPGCRTRTVVDTAPLLERDFAKLAGLGWFGKNTMLINKQVGSWLFLAALLTDVELAIDEPHDTAHCGTCTRCLEACPTDAFVEPYVLDARRCISYLTIELRDQPIPVELREGMQDWVFGCDVCQDVCPWNSKAPASAIDKFVPADDLPESNLRWLLSLSENEFRERFRKTPLDRPGRAGLLRNAAIAAGNSGDVTLIPSLIACLADDEPLIRGSSAWALGQLGGKDAQAALERRRKVETDSVVLSEIDRAWESATDPLSPAVQRRLRNRLTSGGEG